MSNLKHPMQPVVIDADGVHRFKKNTIVERLLDTGPLDLYAIARMGFSQEDHEQLAQLIGYSVCGFCDLSCASEEMKDAAMTASDAIAGRSVEADAPAPGHLDCDGTVPQRDEWEWDETYDRVGLAERCADGWEPYAVTVESDGRGGTTVHHHLKRRVPR